MSQRLLLLLALVLMAPGPGLAATLRVPEDFPRIQPALNGAGPGGTLIDCEGEGGRLRVESCQFIGGRADWGAGVAASWEAVLQLQACHFAGNRAALGGDDLYLVGGRTLLRDCRASAAGILALGGAELRRLDSRPAGQ